MSNRSELMGRFASLPAYLVIFLLLVFSGCASFRSNPQQSGPAPEEESKRYVILLGGQSNMVGLGRVADLETTSLPENIQYLNYGMSPNFSQDSLSFGPEIGLSQVLQQHYPNSNFMLIKYAIGGASLLDWAPDYDSTQAAITGNAHFGAMYDSLWKYVDRATTNETTEFMALLWMQGERDARIPEAGADYYAHFKTFVNRIRQDATLPDLPIIFGQVNPDPARYAAVDTVQSAQQRLARELHNVWMIDTSDLSKWDDQVHYNSAGQLELGRRFGQVLIEHWRDL